MEPVVEIGAPVAGSVVPLDQVRDPAFATGALGTGAGILPADGRILAPLAGRATVVMPHAYGISTEDGLELLIHVGIDTVNLRGAHFTVHIRQGQQLEVGDPLCEVDLAALASAGIDPTVMVVVTAAPGRTAVVPIPRQSAAVGDALIAVIR
ncbi:MAG: PTS glucose transporter subunit IIA [Propionicimonas sp.]